MVDLIAGNNELNVSQVPIAAPTASLYGLVADSVTGYLLSGVKVTINSTVVYTDTYGYYLFEGLTPGNYTITFEKEGYTTLTL